MIDIYTDGSYQPKISHDVIGWAWIIPERQLTSFYSCWRNGISDDIDLLRSHNVGGELIAVVRALEWCYANDIHEVCIHHDYEGVSKWISGVWRTFVPASRWYLGEVTEKYLPFMRIQFEHVIAHSGNEWNEKVDRLAKEAIRSYASEQIR